MAFIKHSNSRVMCPPGEIPDSTDSTKHVVVASMMRSGTHLIIDLILNHFSSFRQNPLYLDLEQYVRSERDLTKIGRLRSSIIKTHLPVATETKGSADSLKKMVESYPIIMPVRSRESMIRSLSKFGSHGMGDDLESVLDRFDRFWAESPKLCLPFEDLVDPKQVRKNIERVGEFIGQEPDDDKLKGPRRIDQRYRVMIDKILTRTLGAHAPRINTTIGFAKR